MSQRRSGPPAGRIGTTSAVALAVATLVGALIGGLVPAVGEQLVGTAPTVRWTAVGALAFLATVLGGLAWTTWRTLHRSRLRIESTRAVNLLVLGKASALAGAFVAGGYLAFALTYAGQSDLALPRERLIRGIAAAIAAAAVCLGGLLLERACRVPGGDDDEDGADPRDGGGPMPTA